MSSTLDLVPADSTPNLSPSEDPPKNSKKSLKQRLKYIKDVITVEPLLAAYVMASLICTPALPTLEYEKACRVNLNLNGSICDEIIASEETVYLKELTEISVLISNLHSWTHPLSTFMPLILVLFLGSYSDRHKMRKPFMLIPIFGEFFAVAGCIVCVIFMDVFPLEALGVLQSVVPSLFGGQTMIVMAVFSYIADVSTIEMRTLRVGILQIVLNCVTPISQAMGGPLFVSLGYVGVLSFAAGLYLFAILYGWFLVKEPKEAARDKKRLCTDLFDSTLAVETFEVILKKKKGTDRVGLLLVWLTIFVYSAVNVGEAALFFQYCFREFRWSSVQYASFLSINTLIHLIGTAVALPIFTKFIKISDIAIILVTFINKIISNVIFGLATTSTMLYVAASVSFLTGVTAIAIRSMATKIVAEDDLGKAQSLFGICEALAGAIAVPVYNKGIYNNTLEIYPSAFFFFGIILFIVCCVIVMGMYVRERKKAARIDDVKNEAELTPYNQKPVESDDVQITSM